MSKAVRRLVILGLLAVGAALSASAQQQDSVVHIDHADSLVGAEINGERVRELVGHVQFTQGKTVVTCQRATQYLATNKIALEGVVEVRDDSLRMVGQRGMYDARSRTAEAFDRVLLQDPSTTLHAAYGKYFIGERKAIFKTGVQVIDTSSVMTSDELTYFRDSAHAIAVGNVKIVNDRNGITITGNRFESFRKRNYSKMTESPEVLQIDTAAGGKRDTLRVSALELESYQDSLERLVATDSVRISRGAMAAVAGSSVYFTKVDSITLEHSPFVWYSAGRGEDNQVSGDTIFLRLERRKLRTVYVRGRAVAISRADSSEPNRFNQMTGREMTLRFADDKIQRIDVDVTATSLYYLFDKGKPNGLNKSSGDHVTMTFAEGKLDKINVSGSVEGRYYPEKLVKGKESSFNLDGFNWREKGSTAKRGSAFSE